jgi:hypothetical protein
MVTAFLPLLARVVPVVDRRSDSPVETGWAPLGRSDAQATVTRRTPAVKEAGQVMDI